MNTGQCLPKCPCKRKGNKTITLCSCLVKVLPAFSTVNFWEGFSIFSGQLALACCSGWRRSLHLWRIWQWLPSLFEIWRIEMYCKNTLVEQVLDSLCISVLHWRVVSHLNFHLTVGGFKHFALLLDFKLDLCFVLMPPSCILLLSNLVKCTNCCN